METVKRRSFQIDVLGHSVLSIFLVISFLHSTQPVASGAETSDAAPPSTCAPSPSGLVGWWRAEGNAKDSAGTNDGTTPFGIAYDAGEVGQAFSFNATSRRVSIPDSPAFKLTNSLTIEGWINIAGDGGFILFRGDNRAGLDPYALTMGSSGHLSFHIESLTSVINLEAPVAYGQWKHVAATLDGASGDMKIYVDGALAAQTNTAIRPFGELDPSLEPAIGIGNSGGTFHDFAFNGLIDEISLYSRALSQSEIQSIYNAGSAGKCQVSCAPQPSGQAGWWKAEGSADDTTGGPSGILSNGVTFAVGKVGQAFSFNGSNSYVEVPDSAKLRLTNVLSIEFWVKRLRLDTPSFPYAEYILEKGGDWTAGQQNYAVALHNSQYNYCLHLLFAGGWRGAGSIADTNWHHCAVVATNGQPDPVFYIDGVFQPITYREGVGTINLYPSTRPLHIGAQYDPQSGWLYFGKTLIDELSLYNRDLSASEIQSIYNAGSAGKCPQPPPPTCIAPPSGLRSWWPGQGNALDAVGGNNGILAGDTSFAPAYVGQGFLLDGSYDAVQVGSATNLQLQDFSIETWIRRSSSDQVSSIPGQDALVFGYGNGGYGFGLDSTGHPLLTTIDVDSLTPATTITDTNFHHLAMTKAGTNVVFYVDGTAFSAPPYHGSFGFYTTAALGARGDNLGNSFLGTIDEVSVYGRALSAAEIMAVFNAGAAGKCRGIIAPSIVSQPRSQTNFVGETVSFSVGAIGDTPLVYQWQFNGSDVPGGTNSTLVVANLQDTNAGNYSVTVTNLAGSVTSSNAVLTVLPRPACTPAPAGIISWWPGQSNALDLVSGNNGSFLGNADVGPGRVGKGFVFDGNGDAVLLGSAPSLQLQDFTIEAWIKRGSTNIASVNSGGGLVFGYGSGGYGLGLGDDGSVFLTRVDIDNVTLSPGITDTDWHHLAVTKSGTTVIFYIDGVAHGVPPYSTLYSFGWPAAIGARGDNFLNSFLGSIDEPTIYNRPLAASEIQSIYNAQVTGKCRIPMPPFISIQPTNKTTYIGSNVTFNVTASGDAPLNYQWFFNDAALPGKTTAALSLVAVQQTNSGNYSVAVSNAVGFAVSSNALLAVNPLPNCAAVSTGLVSWWRGELDLTDSWGSNNGNPVNGIQFGTGKVGRAFSVGAGYVTVPDAPSLHLTNAITIEAWINPTSVTGTRTIVDKFDSAVFFQQTNNSYSLSTVNSGLPSFAVSRFGSTASIVRLTASQPVPANQWTYIVATYDGAAMKLYTNGVLAAQANYSAGIFPGVGNLSIGGTSTSGVSTFNGLLDEISLYSRALSDSEIQAIYNSDVIGKCSVAPTITAQPQDQAIPQGEDALFSVSVLASKPLKYQWRFNGTNLSNATNATLLLEKVQTNRVGTYSVLVSNTLGTALSSNATLSLLPPPVCTAPPPGIISWWPAENIPSDIMGTNTLILQGAGFATGKVGRAFSFNGINTRAQASSSQTLNFGSNADFSIEGWIKALPPVPGATNASVPIVEKRSTDRLTGVGYSLSLNQGRLAFALNSTPFGFSNNAFATFISSGPDLRDSMFHHIALSLNRSSTNGGNLYVDGQLVLTFNGTIQHGNLSNTSPFLVGCPTSTLDSSFFNGFIDELTVYGRALSAAEILAIRQAGATGKCIPPPNIIVQPQSRIAIIGTPTTFRVVASGYPNLSYQWHKNGTNNVGSNSSLFSIQSVSAADAGDYTVTVSNAFGTTLSAVANLAVDHPPSASNMAAATLQNQSISIPNDKFVLSAIDVDGDTLSLSSVSGSSTNGGLVVRGTNDVTYTPVTNYIGSDSFNFVISDGHGGLASAVVLIEVRASDGVSGNMLPLTPIPGGFRISFAGIPGRTYSLQRAESVSGPWITLASVTVGPDGIGTYDDTNSPPSSAYYRTVYP